MNLNSPLPCSKVPMAEILRGPPRSCCPRRRSPAARRRERVVPKMFTKAPDLDLIKQEKQEGAARRPAHTDNLLHGLIRMIRGRDPRLSGSEPGCVIFLECSYRCPVAGLDPATHVLLRPPQCPIEDVDARVKPGQGDLLDLESPQERRNLALKAEPDGRGLDP